MTDKLEITQEDREAAARVFDVYAPNYAALARRNSSVIDGLLVTRVLARHRLQERERMVQSIDEYGEYLVPELRIVTRWLSDHFRQPKEPSK